MYNALTKPCRIGMLQVKNRVVMAPTAMLLDPVSGWPGSVRNFLLARAKGGVGLIIGSVPLLAAGAAESLDSQLPNLQFTEEIRLLADDLHSYGVKFCLEFCYGLGCYAAANPQYPPLSASAIAMPGNPAVLCRELAPAEIPLLLRATAAAAAAAQESGVDAVMLQANGGYFLDQFQSALWNRRQDAYGGSLANRMRLTGELITAVKQACGADFPVLVKFSVCHGTEEGRQLPEGLAACQMLEQAGADALLIDSGSYEETWNRVIPTVYEQDGFALAQIAAVKQAVGIPVVGQGKLADPLVAAQALEDGACDLVALGHALLADPEWANKTFKDLVAAIRPCIGCNECLRAFTEGKAATCAVNPLVGHEGDEAYERRPVKQPCNVLVVGGGPGGAVAALIAAERGSRVQLWEERGQIGGNLLPASAPAFKQDIGRYQEYLRHQLDMSSVRLRLHKKAMVEDILQEDFHQVIISTGACIRRLGLAGEDGPHVYHALEYLSGEAPPSRRLVVIGGGQIGCEIALHAQQQGAKVILLEREAGLLPTAGEPRNNTLALRNMLRNSPVQVVCEARVEQISAQGVHYHRAGQPLLAPGDTVVIAVGLERNRQLADALRAAGVPVVVIGDSRQPRKVLESVAEGFMAALSLR